MRGAPFLHLLALADIAHQRQVEHPLSLLEPANADLDREHGSVLAPVKRLERHGFPGGHAFPHPSDGRLVKARVEIAGVHSDELLTTVAQAFARLPVDVDNGLVIVQEQAVRRMIDECAEARFACAELVLGAPQLRDVLQNPELAQGTAGLVPRDVTLAMHHAHRAIGADDAVFHVVARTADRRYLARRRGSRTVVRMDQAEPASMPLRQFGGRHAEDAARFIRKRDAAGDEVAFPPADARDVLCRFEPPLAFAQAAEHQQAGQRVGEPTADLPEQSLLLGGPAPRMGALVHAEEVRLIPFGMERHGHLRANREALDRYGSDKPDRRFKMELVDLGETFRESSFKVFRSALDAAGVVKAINAKGFAGITIGQADELTEIAKLHGAKGLAFIKVENGEWKSPIVKFFSDAEKTALRSKLNMEEGDCVFFAADKWEIACEVLGRLRLRIAEMQKLMPAGETWNFLWVTDFPLFEWSPDENKWNAMHHPFTRPKAEDMPLFDAKKFPEIRAEAYDVVLNGVEIGGGSMRIYEPPLQEKMFEALGITSEAQQAQFGHLLRAFRLGAPPHGGIAFGFDRLVMLICGEQGIRDVMAFPKNNRGIDLMTQSPAEVDARQLRDLKIQVARDIRKPDIANEITE